MVRASFTTGVTVTTSGWLDQTFNHEFQEGLHKRRKTIYAAGARGLGQRLHETGDRIAGLGAFAHPILGALEIELHVVAVFQRLVRADFLDELPVPRTAGIGHDNAKVRGVFGSHPLHANSNCHKNIASKPPVHPTPQKELVIVVA